MFVHGWAMNAAVWDSCNEHLPDWIDAVCVDLPGHGGMHHLTAESLDEMVMMVAAVTSKPAVWVGWSLGGLVCQRLAVLYPEKVRALYLVASSPKFVRSPDWETAMSLEVFDQFAELFSQNIQKTIRRFIALQLMGSDEAREVMQKLDRAMSLQGLPDEASLALGLDLLRHTDLRDSLMRIECPTGWLLGGGDMLVPEAFAAALPKLMPQADIDIVDGAGHAPFLSHPAEFSTRLSAFVQSRAIAR